MINNNYIYNISTKETLEKANKIGKYETESLLTDGFIHFSKLHQVKMVVNKFYDDITGLVVLVVDTSKLKEELKYEEPSEPMNLDNSFPHLYGPLNLDAIVDVVELSLFLEKNLIHPDTKAMIEHYDFDRLPVEGTYFKSTYRSTMKTSKGVPCGTAMIGMYCAEPLSVSCFHRLPYDEIWHVYGGDPFYLVLLNSDGTSKNILMGTNPLEGQKIQFVIPAHTWQAGYMMPGGRFSLFGCTMAPGFTGAEFEAGIAKDLILKYPEWKKEIVCLSVNGEATKMPEGFSK
ncbi:MAG: cupin domain-containing protein [Clostridiaceae bacterium]